MTDRQTDRQTPFLYIVDFYHLVCILTLEELNTVISSNLSYCLCGDFNILNIDWLLIAASIQSSNNSTFCNIDSGNF